jgi:hypothetical protein
MLNQFAIACTRRIAGSAPRAVASVFHIESRSLPLVALTRTCISVRRTLICYSPYGQFEIGQTISEWIMKSPVENP